MDISTWNIHWNTGIVWLSQHYNKAGNGVKQTSMMTQVNCKCKMRYHVLMMPILWSGTDYFSSFLFPYQEHFCAKNRQRHDECDWSASLADILDMLTCRSRWSGQMQSKIHSAFWSLGQSRSVQIIALFYFSADGTTVEIRQGQSVSSNCSLVAHAAQAGVHYLGSLQPPPQVILLPEQLDSASDPVWSDHRNGAGCAGLPLHSWHQEHWSNNL